MHVIIANKGDKRRARSFTISIIVIIIIASQVSATLSRISIESFL